MRGIVLLCAVLCSGLLQANEQDKEICDGTSDDIFDVFKNCAQRFEQAVGEFKGYVDSNVSKDVNQTQSTKTQQNL
ncbi:MAG: hypothetical protein K2O85_03235 [Helicobacter sp.]|nr:hypothetical protein [Helicobacter sp.]